MFFHNIRFHLHREIFILRLVLPILLIISLPLLSLAQQIDVEESTATVKQKLLKGYTTCIELDVKSVESGLPRFVKSIGKFEKAERNSWEGLNQVIPAISSDAVDFYATMSVSPRCVQVFMAASRSGTADPVSSSAMENIKKMLYDFTLELYRSDIRRQISEAERVVNLAVKAHDKRSEEGEDLKKRLRRNRTEKIRLLEDIELNAKNLEKLKADSVQNVAELETAMEEIRKVRQIAEERKQKLGTVK